MPQEKIYYQKRGLEHEALTIHLKKASKAPNGAKHMNENNLCICDAKNDQEWYIVKFAA